MLNMLLLSTDRSYSVPEYGTRYVLSEKMLEERCSPCMQTKSNNEPPSNWETSSNRHIPAGKCHHAHMSRLCLGSLDSVSLDARPSSRTTPLRPIQVHNPFSSLPGLMGDPPLHRVVLDGRRCRLSRTGQARRLTFQGHLQLLLENVLHPPLDGVQVLGGGDVVLAGRLAAGQG